MTSKVSRSTGPSTQTQDSKTQALLGSAALPAECGQPAFWGLRNKRYDLILEIIK